jgi:hypothetical protein
LQWYVDFHCKAQGDAIINLYGDDMATIWDSITIHQIPEPASAILITLGSLFIGLHRKQNKSGTIVT